ncbi:uncharacterized protein PFL1_03724 [Pseudozyma flocculosa PF-1]|uniref:Uncharacterized protein n=2 Tax=Pseudozyma flocculosa TaxID=84751 RepID=A0A5C3F4H0_9BASI|nr:uncharacterized protein PFL1_03724 [Pseudozyma flocculosa PF-1]EPQ28924.1 hypothetical protein PFL1_03724 [Pseudozyma flocculosa PF-1]SPO38587.1 uncharacterized protein PSFLO_04065 [Pseudozyma flocculosa]
MSRRTVMSFHHILSRTKMATLHGWARELRLCGILKVGYPGVLVCAGPPVVDGAASQAPADDAVAEYVRRIKRLRWQTCTLKAISDLPGCSGSTMAMKRDTAGRNGGGLDPLVALARALDAFQRGASSADATPRGPAAKAVSLHGLVQIESMKDITAILRTADQLIADSRDGRAQQPSSSSSHAKAPSGGAQATGVWEGFYSEAMRSP